VATTDKTAEPELACSFCLKSRSAVTTVIQGPGACICNECVGLCVQIIEDKPKFAARPGAPRLEQQLADEDLLMYLPNVAAASGQVERHLTDCVRQARVRGITWTRIGEALGMTRQSAWERFSGED
jgi:ATP-dependent Clp protease ATP-binding subunit ClpX